MIFPHSHDEFPCDLPRVSSVWVWVRKGVICKSEAFLVLSYKLMLSEMASNLVLFLFFFFLPLHPPHLSILMRQIQIYSFSVRLLMMQENSLGNTHETNAGLRFVCFLVILRLLLDAACCRSLAFCIKSRGLSISLIKSQLLMLSRTPKASWLSTVALLLMVLWVGWQVLCSCHALESPELH